MFTPSKRIGGERDGRAMTAKSRILLVLVEHQAYLYFYIRDYGSSGGNVIGHARKL